MKDDNKLELHMVVLEERIGRLSDLVDKRLGTPLIADDAKELENQIDELIKRISMELAPLAYINDPALSELSEEFYSISEQYRQELSNFPPKDREFFYRVKQIETLQKISPYHFEQFCGALIETLGYTNVVITPKSNDKGVDIIAEKEGLKYVVQCKRYKGTVGSPEIQLFLGAMVNANANKGIFITTGTFTREAILMATGNPIELIDKYRLAEILELHPAD